MINVQELIMLWFMVQSMSMKLVSVDGKDKICMKHTAEIVINMLYQIIQS